MAQLLFAASNLVLLIFLSIVVAAAVYLIVKEVRFRIIRQNTINYFTDVPYSGESVEEILWDIARNAIANLGLKDCVIYLYNEQDKLLYQKAAYGPKNQNFESIESPIIIPLSKGIVGNAASNQETIVIKDTRSDPRYIQDLESNRSELAVPIVYDGKLIGVIDTEHPKKNYYTQKHAIILEDIARLSAPILTATQEKVQAKQKELELVELQSKLATLQIDTLNNQLNPEFIYSSLNAINQFILKGQSDQASLYLTKFSKLIRTVFEQNKYKLIPLKDDIQTLNLYLEFEQLRFDNAFNYDIGLLEHQEPIEPKVPPLLLIPILENTIWRCADTRSQDNQIDIKISRGQAGGVQYQMFEKGQFVLNENLLQDLEIAFESIKSRIAILYPKSVVEIESNFMDKADLIAKGRLHLISLPAF